jgi:Tol biopolymer transport system component
MRRRILLVPILTIASLFAAPSIALTEFPVLKGPYLGQAPPGDVPEIFAPGIISTGGNQVNSVFTPDGREFYFSAFDSGSGYTIMVMSETDAGWSRPRVAPFSGEYSEVDMFITHDGGRFFFISKRPLRKGAPRAKGYQIWVMEREGTVWGTPEHLGPIVNSGSRQLYPTVTRDGTLYFNSDRAGKGRGDFFRSRLVDRQYAEPENLGGAINTEYDETDVFVAPDESYVIFTSVGRPGGFGSGDLYVSFRTKDGSWTRAVNMGEEINTESSEFCPMLSPDGRYFFFTSRRRGNDDIYWVDAAIIERYRGAAPKPPRPLRGEYLGQTPPGMTPVVFAPGIVSTGVSELNAAFTPDGDELYFTRRIDDRNTLMMMRREEGGWTPPAVARFSGTFSDVDPFISRDGRRLYFSSSRPIDGTGASKDSDLWYLERETGGDWGEPVHLDNPNTAGKDDYYTSIADDGMLYFSIFESHGSGGDIFRAQGNEEGFGPAERVGGGISTEANEHDPFVAPDGSYLIFTSNRPGGYGSADLYVSFAGPGGSWTAPVNMGESINSEGYDFTAMLSPDGKYLFFTRNINRNGEIYWVDAKIIKGLRPEGSM